MYHYFAIGYVFTLLLSGSVVFFRFYRSHFWTKISFWIFSLFPIGGMIASCLAFNDDSKFVVARGVLCLFLLAVSASVVDKTLPLCVRRIMFIVLLSQGVIPAFLFLVTQDFNFFVFWPIIVSGKLTFLLGPLYSILLYLFGIFVFSEKRR